MTASALELLPATFSWAPPFKRTLGPEVAELAEIAGFTADPEQQLILDAAFAIHPGGKSVVRDVGICAPRQNLKTGFLKQAALGWLYVSELRLIVWSAHEFGTAQEAFRDMCVLIESCPDLDREVKAIHRGNGEEAIELTGDRRLKFKARTKSGGRGLTGDRIVLDEAMYLTASHMGALLPTLRAVKDPQLVLAGSAGLVESAIWRSYRDRGRAGGDPRLAWFEWSDPDPGGCATLNCDHATTRDGCALDDRARWWATNSALGRRITEDTLAADRDSLPAAEFARETLGWWDDPPTGGGAISAADWKRCADQQSLMTDPVVLAAEISHDLLSASISLAGSRADGKWHVECSFNRPGWTWLIDKVVDARTTMKVATVVVDDKGPGAGPLIEALEARGVTVTKPGPRDLCAGYSRFVNACKPDEDMLRHRNQPEMARALEALRTRALGDQITWERKNTPVDVTPVLSATWALWGHTCKPAQQFFGSWR